MDMPQTRVPSMRCNWMKVRATHNLSDLSDFKSPVILCLLVLPSYCAEASCSLCSQLEKNIWPCQTWSLRGVAGPWIPSTWADAVKHALQICQICQICSVQIYLDQPHSMAILNILSLIAWFLRRWLESRGASWQGWTGWLRWSKIRWVPDRNWCRRRIFGIAVPITTGLRSHSTNVNPD